MTIRAFMKNGDEVDLSPSLGQTPRDVIEGLTKRSITGSAAPLSDLWLETDEGEMIRYSDVARFASAEDERPTV